MPSWPLGTRGPTVKGTGPAAGGFAPAVSGQFPAPAGALLPAGAPEAILGLDSVFSLTASADVTPGASPPAIGPTTSGSGTANFSLNVPAGTVDGDLLIAINSSDFGTLAANPIPGGFTALSTATYDGGNNAVHIAVGYRIAASEPASYTFTVAASSDSAGALLRITGADGVPTITQVASAAFAAAAGTVDSPTLNPSGSNDLLICFAVTDGANGGGAVTWSEPAGMSLVTTVQSTTWTALGVASLGSPSSPSGAKTWTTSTGNHNAGAAGSIAVKAAATVASVRPMVTVASWAAVTRAAVW